MQGVLFLPKGATRQAGLHNPMLMTCVSLVCYSEPDYWCMLSRPFQFTALEDCWCAAVQV